MMQSVPLRPQRAAQSILILEDDAFQRMATRTLLRSAGFQTVHEAGTAQEALRMLSTVVPPIDWVLSDLRLPGMDGVEFIQALAAREQRCALIIASSADASTLAVVKASAQAYGLALAGVLSKPLSAEALSSTLDAWEQRAAPAALRPIEAGPAVSEYCIAEGLSGQQFIPYFQPIVRLSDGSLAGAEVLARWKHPAYGLMMPDSFIPIMEQNGWLVELTEQLIEQSTSALAETSSAGRNTRLAFNLSPSMLARADFVPWLDARVAAAQLSAQHLTLEFTETTAMESHADVLGALARLRLKGYHMSIDDFGIGHSTLQQLAQLPFTELKVDRMFVTNAAADPKRLAVLVHCLELARSLGLPVVAEGVETAEDYQMLRQLGCDMAQGYFIGRPMPAEQVPLWQTRWSESHPCPAL